MFTSRTRSRTLPLAALALAGLAGLTACGAGSSASGKTEVVASIYPVAWLAGKIGGGEVSVQTLTKPGAEPHDLELTPRQIGDVGKAGLTVYVKGVQPAVDGAVAEHAEKTSLDVTSLVKTLPAPTGGEEEHGTEEHGAEGHEHEEPAKGAPDPHVWLDPNRMAAIATALGGRLAAADPDHAAGHKERAAALAAELTALDRAYQDGLRTCERKAIVTAHAAFGYLADRYGLQQISIAGVDPSAEPSPKRLAELTRQIRTAGATTVFTETLVSPKVAETLAREAGVRTAVLDPVEGVAEGSSADYLSIMKKNLEALRPALECR